MTYRRLLLPLAILTAAILADVPREMHSCVAGENWPQFRGAAATGVANDSRPPTRWSATENVRWKVELPGAGASSPIITGERVFVTSYSGAQEARADVDQRHLSCIDFATGKLLWSKSVPAAKPEDAYQGFLREHGYASNTPVTDGERVYVFHGKSGVVAYDLDGQELWKVSVGQDSSNRRWGSGASLMLAGDAVIVNASEESRSIRALNKRTGEELWKFGAETLELCYSTPTLATTADGREDLIVAITEEVWGLNPETGKLRWYAQTQIAGNISPTPIVAGELVYITGGRPVASHAIRVGGKGDVTSTNILWSSRSGSYVATPILFEGHLYWIDDRGQAYCQRATDGDVIYRERVPELSGGRPVYASPVIADGKIYVVTRRDGTYVLPAAPKFEILVKNRLGDDSEFNATPAIVGDDLLLRSDRAIYRIGNP